jgi:uncharacterized protein YbjT (DUF2867 family)
MTHGEETILVTGAAGGVGSVGRTIVEQLRNDDRRVRALVHREDGRADALRSFGAEVVVGDLTRTEDVVRAMTGCRRVYFSMSVSPHYLEATCAALAVARSLGDIEVFVNMSQMTVSEMSLTHMTDSPQQRLHWLAEQVVNWSGLPSVHIRPTLFLDNPLFLEFAARSIKRDGKLRLPFGSGRSSPISTRDVARVVVTILRDPAPHIGAVYELTGARSQDMHAVAEEYAQALQRPVEYADVEFATWQAETLATIPLPKHALDHIAAMADLHAENRYDRLTDTVFKITGKQPTSVREFITDQRARFR